MALDISANPIGQPVDRVDGRLKVTGGAPYAYEHRLERAPAYGVIVPATIAKGRVRAIDATAAEAAPGVLLVMTHRNAPKQPAFGPPRASARFARARPYLGDDRVRHWGEPVAFVVADTFEAARAAAALVTVEYQAETPVLGLERHLKAAYAPETINVGMKTDTSEGDFEAAFAAGPVTVDATYHVAQQHHMALEPHAAIASWEGDEVTVRTSTQNVANTRKALAATLEIPLEKVRIVSPYVGGGFGGKLGMRAEVVLAAFGARTLKRPVKVAQSRQQVFSNVGHRPEAIQRVRLSATRDGKLTGVSHEVWMQSSPIEEFAEQTASSTRALYGAPSILTRHRLVNLDMQGGEPVRAPGEAPGLLALESAVDELAHKLGLDPVEMRILNDTQTDPEKKVPFSSRKLVECLREGAARFGWSDRPKAPRERRDGPTLIGYGVAAAIRPNYLGPCAATVRVAEDRTVRVRTDMTDIGTGTYTILAQVAAEELGVPLHAVTVELGDSRFPVSPGSGGSWGAASSASAVLDAARKVKAEMARTDEARVFEATGSVKGMRETQSYKDYSQYCFGAHFAEVAVDEDTGEIRLRRMLGAFAAGRILNAKTARSQMIGGMIWGVSSALFEEAVVDPRFGHVVNGDLGEYHVAAHADVPNVDAFFIEEHDDKANPLGAKGVGELGICGAGAAVANAVFNATGVRVREFPITLDKVLVG
ncbi:xanthine dehydrogenase family protein molybdopterin-binding subunit [Methylopila sp. Yamaguchi]|uniref:xanthine dehydrogenase family protein molybdopterin-binding subunit n=1 Tax=Methylopila sp. Yamaguchi TaxID=1437817 RepID=UPI000CCA54AE|nr:xanthine dehydrogenase family protein molybdopterin-binding subunit [Methylopila sp. Yamaguchi]GBD47900.1 aldehyde oxidase [Methylopila sp. Yamaguchi]